MPSALFEPVEPVESGADVLEVWFAVVDPAVAELMLLSPSIVGSSVKQPAASHRPPTHASRTHPRSSSFTEPEYQAAAAARSPRRWSPTAHRDGNFWGIDRSGSYNLVRVDRQAFTYEIFPGPGPGGYGIAVDSEGRPWYCAGGGAWRFDQGTGTWDSLPSPGGNAWGGCMTDGEGTLWHCRQQDAMLVGIDTESLTVVQQIQLPAYAHGVSIDFDGNVWAVGFNSSQAFRVDPVTGTIDTFSDLVGAYTYSDMTGFALSTAGTPSG